jgi:hypothetical protein
MCSCQKKKKLQQAPLVSFFSSLFSSFIYPWLLPPRWCGWPLASEETKCYIKVLLPFQIISCFNFFGTLIFFARKESSIHYLECSLQSRATNCSTHTGDRPRHTAAWAVRFASCASSWVTQFCSLLKCLTTSPGSSSPASLASLIMGGRHDLLFSGSWRILTILKQSVSKMDLHLHHFTPSCRPVLVHLFYYTSRYNNMSRSIAKWMRKKVKATYHLKRRGY